MYPDENSFSQLLISICRAHRAAVEDVLHPLGLYAGQEVLLIHLWNEEGVAQSQLVDNMCVEPPTISKMLQRLETAGLVERRQDTQDMRVSRVFLTPAGRALRLPVLNAWAEVEGKTLRGFNQTEQVLLRRLLLQMYTNLTEA